ncbi:MAG: hypothetical protein OXM61_15135 [Candidatus Poribacteria bacterium]|nr:hypothetical protein [Candidatus Poribacteria bacterium]
MPHAHSANGIHTRQMPKRRVALIWTDAKKACGVDLDRCQKGVWR